MLARCACCCWKALVEELVAVEHSWIATIINNSYHETIIIAYVLHTKDYGFMSPLSSTN